MNALALSLTPSFSSGETFLIKGCCGGARGVLRERMKTNRGRGGEESSPMRDQALSLCSLFQKNFLIFQTAKRVPSNKMLGGS